MDSSRDFLTIVRDFSEMARPIRADLMWLLVNIAHRMTGAGDHYTVAFPDSERTDEIRALLDHENDELSAPPNFP